MLQEQIQERLIAMYSEQMNDVSTTLGNTLYKVARDNNPTIKADSPVNEKINSLPSADRNILFQTLAQAADNIDLYLAVSSNSEVIS